MFRFRSRENAQRKYVDLIKEAAAKWPNWDPPRRIYVSTALNSLARQRLSDRFSHQTKQAGDFGTINKKTGELLVEGNIYSHVDTKEIASRYPAVPAPGVDQFEIHSYEVRGIDINTSAGA
jgi:hypothetical protein